MLAPAEPDPAQQDRVLWSDPERLSGMPCFTGTRVPVKALFDYLEAGDTLDTFLDDFPGVTREHVIGALRLGRDRLLVGCAIR